MRYLPPTEFAAMMAKTDAEDGVLDEEVRIGAVKA